MSLKRYIVGRSTSSRERRDDVLPAVNFASGRSVLLGDLTAESAIFHLNFDSKFETSGPKNFYNRRKFHPTRHGRCDWRDVRLVMLVTRGKKELLSSKVVVFASTSRILSLTEVSPSKKVSCFEYIPLNLKGEKLE